MPLYNYKCTDCNKEFNFVHDMNETKEVCEECNGKLKKLLSSFRRFEKDNKKLAAKERIDKFIEEAKGEFKNEVKKARKDYDK